MNRILLGSISRNVLSNPARHKAKVATNPLKARHKKQSTELAMNHFDTFYGQVYRRRWQSIRLALLSANKYAAVINNFNQSDQAEIDLRVDGAYNLRYIYEKNLRRIKRQKAKNEWLAERKEKMANNDDSKSLDGSEQLATSSDSEFETIGAFFTDTEDAGSDFFVNAAQMEIDFNDFVPVSELKYSDAENEMPAELNYFQFYDDKDLLAIEKQNQQRLTMPESLNIYTYLRNDFRPFTSPKLSKTNLFNYYLLDCASSLPVLALDIEPGNHVADLCAGPGGKSLMAFLAGGESCQYFLNELSPSRMIRLKGVFNSFVPRSKQSKIVFSQADASQIKARNGFDKVLVDVPCTNDRHSLYEDDNNIFSMGRLHERAAMPTKQMSILTNALDMVRPGGSIVYSTCSLSPIQNDGVVHMSLKKWMQQDKGTFAIADLREAFRPFRAVFRFDHQFRYGTQVLPNICHNFGPMYICKLVRTE